MFDEFDRAIYYSGDYTISKGAVHVKSGHLKESEVVAIVLSVIVVVVGCIVGMMAYSMRKEKSTGRRRRAATEVDGHGGHTHVGDSSDEEERVR